ncbi:STAS domain-containing protein [Lacisediminihabitans profunda]|uniref:Anti-sigma factor antagonist n=1 Tax=Lacisediminihabitans profunda TaxID=2594790 RepID=A0A5C8UU15_9MICO|nr:STAS domain-containing protein [Lacisediminihabitans profunda]TXN31126.1 STAS domain-containing protein [Lacisediminihabitans profunda]
MEFTSGEIADGIAVVRPTGRLNMVSAGRLRELITSTVAGGRSRVVVDLTGVEFIDSSGLGALISGLKTARQAGGDLRIAAPNEQVSLVLRLTNMDRVLPVYASAETAYGNG